MAEYPVDETNTTERATEPKISLPPDFPEVSGEEIKTAEKGLAHLQGKISEAELRSLATQIARGERARHLYSIDDLTRLYRGEYARTLVLEGIQEKLVVHLGKPQQEVGIMFFDLLDLKDFNDQYDHATGDKALKAIAEHVGHLMEMKPGRLARVENLVLIPWRANEHGDEFGIACFGGEVGERMIEEVAQLLRSTWPHIEAPDGKSLPVKFSFGTASSSEPEINLNQLLADFGDRPQEAAGELFQGLYTLAEERERKHKSVLKSNV